MVETRHGDVHEGAAPVRRGAAVPARAPREGTKSVSLNRGVGDSQRHDSQRKDSFLERVLAHNRVMYGTLMVVR
jgi:hypothetical protein